MLTAVAQVVPTGPNRFALVLGAQELIPNAAYDQLKPAMRLVNQYRSIQFKPVCELELCVAGWLQGEVASSTNPRSKA